MSISTGAIAALVRLDERQHRARVVFVGAAGEYINEEEAQELLREGFANVSQYDGGPRVLSITDEGRAKLQRERGWIRG